MLLRPHGGVTAHGTDSHRPAARFPGRPWGALARLPGSGPPAWLWPACLALARLPGSGPPAGVTLRPEARHIDVLGGCPAGDRLTAERSYETRKAGGDSRNPVTGRRG